jgi:hypothetical protein
MDGLQVIYQDNFYLFVHMKTCSGNDEAGEP